MTPRISHVLALCCVIASTAHADGGALHLEDSFGIQLNAAFATSRTDILPATGTPLEAQAEGVIMRASGSLLRMFSLKSPSREPGLHISDWWSFDLGFGWVHPTGDCSMAGVACSSGPWVYFRLEPAIRPVYIVSDDLEVFARFGGFVGTTTATADASFRGIEAAFATAGARTGPLIFEGGVGTNGYLLGRASYALRPTAQLFPFIGVRVERGGASNSDFVNSGTYGVLLTFGSN